VGPQSRSGRAENLVPTGIRSRTVQPVAQSIYRLSYPAHKHTHTHIYIYICVCVCVCVWTYVKPFYFKIHSENSVSVSLQKD